MDFAANPNLHIFFLLNCQKKNSRSKIAVAVRFYDIVSYSEAAVASKSSPEFGFWQYFIEAL